MIEEVELKPAGVEAETDREGAEVVPPAPPSRGRRAARRLAWLLLVASLATLVYQLVTWPDVAALAEHDPTSTAFIDRHRARAAARGEPATVDWRRVPYSAISRNLKRAVLVAEDVDFFSHDGFAGAEIRAALREALAERELPRGASTITQQLAKNLWLSPSRNPWRKIKEALLTRQLERRLSKRRILELYLNVVELGPGIYGVEAGARRYFGVSASALGPRQSAELAAALPNPRRWHPGSTAKGYHRHVARIETRARAAAWLDGSL